MRRAHHGQKRVLPHETKLLLAATGALRLRGGAAARHRNELRVLVRVPLSPGVDPAWRLLHVAALAYLDAGDNHPLRPEIIRLLNDAIDLAQKVPLHAQWQPKYTGGAAAHYGPEADR
jgi:hypothetical protein